jgi:hypothetical protein
VSRHRYEKYKSGKTLREVKNLGAKWDDVIWDYARGYIDFSPTTASNANLAELVEQWEQRGIESSPTAYVNSEGIVNTSSQFSFLSFEESIQQDYAQMALEHIESLTHRAQRVLQKGLNNQTLEQFAHCCASRIMHSSLIALCCWNLSGEESVSVSLSLQPVVMPCCCSLWHMSTPTVDVQQK